jgi:hypothetical protein
MKTRTARIKTKENMKKTLLLAAASALLFMGCDQNQGGSDADQTSPTYGTDQWGTQADTNPPSTTSPGMTDPGAAGGTGTNDQGIGTGAGAGTGTTDTTDQTQPMDTNSVGSGTQNQDQTAPPQQ